MPLPPRPERAPRAVPVVAVPPEPAPAANERAAPRAELDADTRAQLADVIARAIAEQLGSVRISSIPPSEPAPRSSMRAAANVGGKLGKGAVFASGALSLAGSLIVWLIRPEYAAPLAQAMKLIAQVIMLAGGGGAPVGDQAPARDVPALVAPAPAPDASP